jgi:oligoendopeptidase F
MTTTDADLTAADVSWDLPPLLGGRASIDELLDEADTVTAELAQTGRGHIATMDAAALAAFHHRLADLQDLVGRAGNYASLRFAENTGEPANGALLAKVEERSTAMFTQLLFIDLEWAEATDEHVDEVLADPALDFVVHHLRSARRFRDHLLSEPEEKILTEKYLTGASAWGRLFDELTSAITVELPATSSPDMSSPDTPSVGTNGSAPTHTVSLEQALSRLQHPDREVRQQAASAVTAGLAPGLRTRAFVFNTLLNDKAIDDRLRSYPSWISARNLSNEASDESVQALVDAVQARYDIPQRWYTLKARILGIDKLADYDRMASVAQAESSIGWDAAKDIVLDAYGSFSTELADVAQKFFDENWIDAPMRPGKRPGAFCAYTVPTHHPYLLLNWTSRTRDVATLAHELGHGLHAYLAREQGAFHQSTPLTLAETASVFGETVTNRRLLGLLDDPNERLALLASILEDSIATVFRQTAMNRFEAAVHTARRTDGELSVERFGELWAQSQTAMLGDSVEVTEGYRSWWSYIPHFMHTPGYVYAYAYGQLLALSVYAQYEQHGDAFVPQYLELLRAGGSKAPEDLGRIVGCDLADPSFWDGGLDIIDGQLRTAEEAATAAGRV